MSKLNSFNTLETLTIDKQQYNYYSLTQLAQQHDLSHLPFALKILLENLLRKEDGVAVQASDIEALINWDAKAAPSQEIAFTPARVILQDFTGVPAVVDLAAMRDAMQKLGGDPNKINPLSPVELVIDHSVMVDYYGKADAFQKNNAKEFERNIERYRFLSWGQNALNNFKVVPPGTGIVHQVNLEYLARVIFQLDHSDIPLLYPDTVVGTDSHTTMINGLGVLGWGVGGIEAEAAMLGQPITMLIPQVVGFKLTGSLPEGTTATDLVLRVVEMLREKGVVGKFVEFYGEGLNHLPLADRATIANMAPEYGATCGIFPIDAETIKFLHLSGRDKNKIACIEAYAKAQGIFREDGQEEATYSDSLTLDLRSIEPCIAGPKRPQDRIGLTTTKQKYQQIAMAEEFSGATPKVTANGEDFSLTDGAVVIAAITSCTNTSNPDVMIAAGLLAKRAHEIGLKPKPWVKTSLAPGSQVVSDYLDKADLTKHLEAIGFNLVGYGCTTCIGNSGPLDPAISDAITSNNLGVSAVLSGNRNFEGRVHPLVKLAYLASPPLVVAYALAGSMNFDFQTDALGEDEQGNSIFLKDIWPSRSQINETVQSALQADMFTSRYASVFEGNKDWQSLNAPEGTRYSWDAVSTYVKHPPYFKDMGIQPMPLQDIENARVLVKLGDSVTTDHISPAGSIAQNSPAANYLLEKGVEAKDFNSYGSRRGNHEIMMRGTFANIRLRNQLAPGTEGSWTKHFPTDTQMSIFDASIKYQDEQIPLIVIAGKEYGTGSSRDWAAKGPRLLGVKVVICESYERIHRSNLIGMGILPLQFKSGENADTLKLSGEEYFTIRLDNLKPGNHVTVEVKTATGQHTAFDTKVRIDTPNEMAYFKHGGILHYVLRQLAS